MEGFAVSYANFRTLLTVFRSKQQHLELLDAALNTNGNTIDGEAYEVAGYFVSWLIDEFGLDAVKRLYEAVPRHSSRQDLERHFKNELGTALPALISRMADDMPDSEFENRCYLSSLHPWNEKENQWQALIEFSLRNPEVDNPWLSEKLSTIRQIEIPVSGDYRFRVAVPEATGKASVNLARCGVMQDEKQFRPRFIYNALNMPPPTSTKTFCPLRPGVMRFSSRISTWQQRRLKRTTTGSS
jgi:hypothetical protein